MVKNWVFRKTDFSSPSGDSFQVFISKTVRSIVVFKITVFSTLPNDMIMYNKNFYIRVLFIVCLLIVFICCSPAFATEWYKDYYRAQETA
jgi:uncharacterized membrane protein